MTRTHIFTKADFTIGALYRLGARGRLSRERIIELLASRAGMKPAAARQLVGHWYPTWPKRTEAA